MVGVSVCVGVLVIERVLVFVAVLVAVGVLVMVGDTVCDGVYVCAIVIYPIHVPPCASLLLPSAQVVVDQVKLSRYPMYLNVAFVMFAPLMSI